MIYFVEIWNPTEKWLSLPKEERAAYLKNIADATAELISLGVEVLTWSINDSATSYRSGYDYFAIWKFPNQEIADQFQAAVTHAGWYHYFEQKNIMGEEQSAEQVLKHLVELN